MKRPPLIAVAAAFAIAVAVAVTARADLGGKEPAPIPDRSAGLGKSRGPTMQWLGVAIGEAPLEISARLPIAPGTGLVVSQVIAGSPAALAGLQPDDVLARLNDQILVTLKQLQTLVMHRKAGDVVEITFFRKGEKRKAVAVLMPRENI